LPYSDAVLAGNTLYLAGRIGIDPQTGRPPDVEKEIRLLLDGTKNTLRTADLTARAFIGSGALLRGGHFEMQGIAVRR
jgi:enamine deaminase RidA (YjgF/YER057c/UK114 family)